MMPIACPSSSGKNWVPKSSTMWCTSASASAAVRRKLPATVALIGLFSVYWFRYGCAADHGAQAELGETAALACGVSLSASGAGVVSGATASAGYCFCGGSSSQPSCASSEYASGLGTRCQWSMLPVGHGEMQALQPLQMSTSTT